MLRRSRSPLLRRVPAALFALFALLGGTAARPQGASPPGSGLPKEAEKIGEDLFRIGKVRVDLKAKTLTCSGKINMSKGTIEYLAVAPRGKRHESVLVLDAHPLHFQLGLILLGLEPKGGIMRTPNPRVSQGEPKGSPVDLWVLWQRGGRAVRVAGETLAWDIGKRRPMESGAWIFSGSTGGFSGFVAEEDLSMVATYRDPVAVINNALPQGLDDTIYKANERVLPPVGTPVTFSVTPRT
jgi:hypothetical protein